MDWIDTLAPLGLSGLWLGNELMFALATESYAMAYGPVRIALIPACSGLLIASSVVRWWSIQRGDENRSQHLAGCLLGIVVGTGIWAFQWFSSSPSFFSGR